MSRYPDETTARFDRQFTETEEERNERLAARRNGSSRLVYDKEKRTIVPVVDPSKHRRCLPKGECAYCDANGDYPMMPRHYASARCESGKHPHCTCDVCF